MKLSIPKLVSATSVAIICALSPAQAQDIDDEIIRAETQIETLESGDAMKFAADDFNTAKLRVEEAKAAEASGDDTQAMQRIKEARLHAEIVQAEIKLGALERTKAELEDALDALRREATS